MAKKFQGLSAKQFIHPLDLAGMQKLKDIIPSGLTEKAQVVVEDEFYLLNLADNTRLSEVQGGSVYQLVKQVADILDVGVVPHVFLDTNAELNAYALGGKNPSIVLTSALVDTFSESLLRVVIAHELGHIICRHTFYRLLASNFELLSSLLSGLLELVPFVGSILSKVSENSVRMFLLDWYRKSELSADRAALLGAQDLEVVQECIFHLAGGSKRLASELRLSEFLTQADEFQKRTKTKEDQDSGITGLFSYSLMTQQAMSTHPWPAVRLQEITNWASSKEYKRLLQKGIDQPLLSLPSMRTRKDAKEHPIPTIGENDKQIAIIHLVEDYVSKETTSVKAKLDERFLLLDKSLIDYKTQMDILKKDSASTATKLGDLQEKLDDVSKNFTMPLNNYKAEVESVRKDIGGEVKDLQEKVKDLSGKLESGQLTLRKSIDPLSKRLETLQPKESNVKEFPTLTTSKNDVQSTLEKGNSVSSKNKYTYDYEAMDERGWRFTGCIEAEDEKILEHKINQMGYYLIEAKKKIS